MLVNIISNWSNIFLTIISTFVLYPFCVRCLGDSQYGVWLLVVSATGYFSLLQLGVPLANVRYVSKYHAQGDYNRVNEVLSTNITFFGGISVIVLLSGTILAFSLDRVFNIPQQYSKLAFWSVLLSAINISLGLVFEIFEGFLHAVEKFLVVNIVKNVALLARVALTFLALTSSNGLLTLPLLLIMVTVLQGATFLVYLRVNYPYLNIAHRHSSSEVFKEIAAYGMFVLLFQLAGRISFQTDAMVIGRTISTSAIVVFTVGNNLLLYLMEFVIGISRAIMPRVSNKEGKCEYEEIRQLYQTYSERIFLIIQPACLFFLIFGGDFIALWMGESFRQSSGNVLSILTLSYLFFLVQRGIAFPILMGTSNLKFPTCAMLTMALLNLVLSLLLGRKFGVAGVAWGTTIPNLIVTVIIIGYMKHKFEVKVLEYVAQSICRPLLLSLAFIVPCLAFKLSFEEITILKLITAGLASTAVYAASVCIKNGWSMSVVNYLRRRLVRV